jgi:hypothetical protein
MAIALEVKSDAPSIKAHREAAARLVIDHFDASLPDSRLLCFLDDEDPHELRKKYGPANRGGYLRVHDPADLDGRPPYVRRLVYPYHIVGGQTRVFDGVVYLYGTTCADEVGLSMTLAHELQHAVQFSKERQLWAVNSLVAQGLTPETVATLRLEWKDIPIEVDARIVSKRLAESLFGEERVLRYIDDKISARITESDVADWQFVRSLTGLSTVDLASETRRLYERLRGYRSELEDALQLPQMQSPDYADIDLDAFFDLAATRG